MKICAVVVTHNRCAQLRDCILSLKRQRSIILSHIIIVDNASSDETAKWLKHLISNDTVKLVTYTLNQNIGGAGGFRYGLGVAISGDADWIWLMDDDAVPHPSALEELMKIAADPTNVYGSLAVNGTDTSWLTTVLDPPLGELEIAASVPECGVVQSLPFLGFLIHRTLVERIGLPDADFFIAADDTEYCVRAHKAGAKIIIAGKSRIEHPKSRPSHMRILGQRVVFLSLPPWKRYYDTRNRVLIARKYYGMRLLTQTIPGSFVRLFAALVSEPRKGMQFWAWCCGMFDGLFGIKGKRHEKWGIKA